MDAAAKNKFTRHSICRAHGHEQIGFPESWYLGAIKACAFFVLNRFPHLLPLACHSALDRLLVQLADAKDGHRPFYQLSFQEPGERRLNLSAMWNARCA